MAARRACSSVLQVHATHARVYIVWSSSGKADICLIIRKCHIIGIQPVPKIYAACIQKTQRNKITKTQPYEYHFKNTNTYVEPISESHKKFAKPTNQATIGNSLRALYATIGNEV